MIKEGGSGDYIPLHNPLDLQCSLACLRVPTALGGTRVEVLGIGTDRTFTPRGFLPDSPWTVIVGYCS